MPVTTSVRVRLDLASLRRFRDAVASGTPAEITGALKQWGAIYRGWVRERFDRYSRGGGDWPPLAESTKRRRRGPRRGHKGPRRFSILRDTGQLFAALNPDYRALPGQLQQRRGALQITLGYGGSGLHREAGMTVDRLAEIHSRGEGHVPIRKIIVRPPRRVVDRMADVMRRAVAAVARRTGVS